jgi:stage III sporulation protein AE
LGFFGQILSSVLLVAILSLFTKKLEGGGARAATYGIAAVLAVSVFLAARSDMTLVEGTLDGMRTLSDALVPLFATLFASGGSAGTAAAAASGFSTLSFLLTHVITAVLFPMLYFLFGLCALSVFGEGAATDGLFRTVRGLYLTVILFLSVLLVTSLGFQTTLSASADSLTVGSVRFAIGNLIPVVGGTLGGSLRTLSASLSLIRSTVGTLSVVSLLLSVLPVLVSLLLHRFCLSLAADLSGMLGAGEAKRIFDGFRGIYDLAAATLALALVLFFFVLGILCHTVTAIG